MPQDETKAGASTASETEEEKEETEVEDEKEAEGAEVDEEEIDPTPPKGPYNKDPRWGQVYGGYQLSRQYASFGTPADIARKLARAEIIEEEMARAGSDEGEADAELTEAEATEQQKVTKVRKDLETIYPELIQFGKMIGNYAESLERRARSETIKIAKESGVDPKHLETTLSAIINEDPDMYFEYVGDPRSAVRQAAERYLNPKGRKPTPSREQAAATLKGKEKKEGLPATHRASGGVPSTPGKSAEGPKNLREAFKNINAKLKAKGLA